MLLSELPNDHTAMLRHYLAWWAAYRDVLLWGQLRAPRPDLGYPVVTAVKGPNSVTISYASESVINVSPGRATVANATGSDSVVVNLTSPATVEAVTDCFEFPLQTAPATYQRACIIFRYPAAAPAYSRAKGKSDR